MKLILRTLGALILLVVFLVVYGLVADIAPGKGGFRSGKQTIGKLGGYHLFYDVTFEEQDEFYRIGFITKLNRSSILSDIAVPRIEVIPNTKDEPVLFGSGPKLLTDLGNYRLTVNLSDTRRFDLSGNTAELVFVGKEKQIIGKGPITEIRVHQPPDDSLQQVLIGLSEPVLYRLKANTNEPGIVWLDILK
ncbi:hypothetical protein DRH29_03835 [candidate division Kazan bacterium]|uniref:Uncharacterized protein n=1 Tax=candidate division Kazan bacterium TaxID=2202143 RepID=A0A420ZC44_UNCK3|nr:MAG: hypothetical protein DRH29_03835 [candidate division Kazan bacterium]